VLKYHRIFCIAAFIARLQRSRSHTVLRTWADGPGYYIFAPSALRSRVLTQQSFDTGILHGRRQSRRSAELVAESQRHSARKVAEPQTRQVGCGKPEAFRTEGGRAAETPGRLRKARGIPHGRRQSRRDAGPAAESQRHSARRAAGPQTRQVGCGKAKGIPLGEPLASRLFWPRFKLQTSLIIRVPLNVADGQFQAGFSACKTKRRDC